MKQEIAEKVKAFHPHLIYKKTPVKPIELQAKDWTKIKPIVNAATLHYERFMISRGVNTDWVGEKVIGTDAEI